jgi:hypothetical protein
VKGAGRVFAIMVFIYFWFIFIKIMLSRKGKCKGTTFKQNSLISCKKNEADVLKIID